MLENMAVLNTAYWRAHLPYLRGTYLEWQFVEMFQS
jgi:hypothetical protein